MCMVKVMKFVGIFIVSLVIFTACGEEGPCGEKPDDYKKIELSIERLEDDILDLSSRDEIRDFIAREPIVAEFFLLRNEYPNDSIFVEEMYRRFTHPMIDSLQMEIKKVFSDLSGLKEEFEEAFSLLKYYYPDAPLPKIKTVATGFDYDLLVSDTLIIVGLDYYLGEDAKFRPRNTYNYILKRYKPKFIVPSTMLIYGISGNYNYENEEDLTILADMISYGKSFYFTKRMMPCTPDSVLIWYSDTEMEGLDQNADIVWSHFLEENLLWESSHLVKRKYLEERPKTYEIGPACPPRIGTWLGWQIIKEYMEKNPQMTLPELMQNADAKAIFEEAKYRPD